MHLMHTYTYVWLQNTCNIYNAALAIPMFLALMTVSNLEGKNNPESFWTGISDFVPGLDIITYYSHRLAYRLFM